MSPQNVFFPCPMSLHNLHVKFTQFLTSNIVKNTSKHFPFQGLDAWKALHKARPRNTECNLDEAWNFTRELKKEWNRVRDTAVFVQDVLPEMIEGNASAWLTSTHGLMTLPELLGSFVKTFTGITKHELQASLKRKWG